MTQLLDKAIERARSLPASAQDELAQVVLQLAGDEQPVYVLTEAEEEMLKASLAEAAAGQFATEDELSAIWQKHEP